MPPHPLTNFYIQRYYQNEQRFNDVYSRNHLPESKLNNVYVVTVSACAALITTAQIKDVWAHVIKFDKYKSIGKHWIALYVSGNK